MPRGLPKPFLPILILGAAVAGPWRTASAADSGGNQEKLLRQYDFDQYARQPISFYYCQAGFEPSGYKPIYLWTRERFSSGTAAAREVSTGKTIAIPLVSPGMNPWGRQDWVADCSRLAVEGDYTLQVEIGGHKAETAPFTISKHCYDELREKAAKHYFLKRCGIFCHVHDARLYSLDPATFGKVLREVPAQGGWHDAHDDNKWVAFAWTALYGLLKTQERFSPCWAAANEPYPYCLAEAWWEVEWLLRMQKADGTFYSGVFEWFPYQDKGRTVLRIHHREQNYDDLHRDRRAVLDVWGQNAMCHVLGRTHNTAPSTAPKYFAYCAHAIRYCGRLMRPLNEKNAQRCADGARKTIAWLEDLKAYPPYQELEVHAGLALSWLEEARDGGGPSALAKAEGHLQHILELQQAAGHFHSSASCRGLEFFPQEAGDDRTFVDYPFGYMLALAEYLDYARQQEGKGCALVGPVRDAYSRFARLLERFCAGSAFRQIGEPRIDGPSAAIIPLRIAVHGYNPFLLSAGVVFAAAERLAGVPGGQKLAQCQLQWVLGANPRFMSFMNQLGPRNAGQYAASSSATASYYPMAFYRHLRDMRWGVTTGIFGSREGQPPNYPNAGSAMDGRYNSTAQETWLNCNGWLLLLLAELG